MQQDNKEIFWSLWLLFQCCSTLKTKVAVCLKR